MKPGWWLLAVPVGAVLVAELAGDRLFGVREVRPAPPGRPPVPPGAFDPGPAADPALVELLREFTAAARDGRPAAALDRFDPVRFHTLVTRTDTFRAAGVAPDPGHGPVKARAAVAALLGGGGLAADAVEVRRVVPGDEPDEAVVYARHRTGGRGGSYRWWAARSARGWKVIDVEDVRSGVRLTRQAAAQLAGPLDADVAAGLAALPVAADKLASGDFPAAAAALAPARAVTLPRDGFAVRCLIEGGIAAVRGRATEAREWADRADAAAPGLPGTAYLRAAAAAAVGEWEAAADAARAYLAAVGPDAPAARILGTALRELGRHAEAAAAFELGLADDPTREDLRAALAHVRSLPR